MASIDPRAALLDTRLPLALLPVRIETRFAQEHGTSSLLVFPVVGEKAGDAFRHPFRYAP